MFICIVGGTVNQRRKDDLNVKGEMKKKKYKKNKKIKSTNGHFNKGVVWCSPTFTIFVSGLSFPM